MRIGINLMFVGAGLAGGRVYAEGLLRGLAEIGGQDEFTLFTRQDAILPPLPADRFHIHRSGIPASSNFRRTFWEYMLLPRIARRHAPDVFHGAGGVSPGVKHTPLVLTIQDLIYHHFPQSVPTGARLFMQWMLPRSARRAVRIIVPSQATARDVIEILRVPEERVRLVHDGPGNPLDPSLTKERDPARIAKYGLAAPFILSVGRAYPHKNLAGLARALAALHQRHGLDPSWVHVGDVLHPGSELDRLTQELGIAPRVRFLGTVDIGELGALYAAATVFAFPSLMEGFGLPVLEAMAHGIPVVSSNAGSLPEVVGDAGILADARDPDVFAAALARALVDANLRTALAEKGRTQLAKYSWTRCATETLNVLCEAAGP
jgi:glycosyltransferase involved in cell wall biosynthesis